MKKSLSVILPAFNEQDNIELVIKSALEFLPSVTSHYEIIVVDDGSSDRTPQIVDSLARRYQEVVSLHHPGNQGYGATLRTGFDQAKNDLIFFMDGDGQFDIKELSLLVNFIEETDLVCGYRIKRADSLRRKINAQLYNWLIKSLFDLKVRDIDCAFKLLRHQVIKNINLESSGALINAELLILAKKKGYQIREVGITHYPRAKGKQTGAKLLVIWRAFTELMEFKKRLKDKKIGGEKN